MGLILEILVLGVIGVLTILLLRKDDFVNYKKYLAVSDDTPLAIANCGKFDESGQGSPDVPLSIRDIDEKMIKASKGKFYVGVPDEILSEDPNVQNHFPVIAYGSSMVKYGIDEGDVVWVRTDSDQEYAKDDCVLIVNRSRSALKIRKLADKLEGDLWETISCSENSQEESGKHAQKRFLSKVDFVTHRQGHCASGALR